MKIIRIGKFKIVQNGLTVSMSPGDLQCNEIHNKETVCTYFDQGASDYQVKVFTRYARNKTNERIWRRLNRAPLPLYLRFQKFVARNNSGKWVRGINIHKGKVSLNLE